MKNRKLNRILICCMLFVSPFLAMADDDLGGGNDGGDVQDIPTAPINDYVPFAFVVVFGISYVLLAKRKKL